MQQASKLQEIQIPGPRVVEIVEAEDKATQTDPSEKKDDAPGES